MNIIESNLSSRSPDILLAIAGYYFLVGASVFAREPQSIPSGEKKRELTTTFADGRTAQRSFKHRPVRSAAKHRLDTAAAILSPGIDLERKVVLRDDL